MAPQETPHNIRCCKPCIACMKQGVSWQYPQLKHWFIQENGGITKEGEYPYVAQRHHSVCNKNRQASMSKAVVVRGYEKVLAREAALLKAVAHKPVPAPVDASEYDFRFYSSGVYEGSCTAKHNHNRVTVVGYGTTGDGVDHWLVKNTWGYVRLAVLPSWLPSL